MTARTATKEPTEGSNDKVAAFAFHGVHLVEKGNQGVGDCPFCGKEKHFMAKLKTGQWDCKSCGESGNVYSFLAKLYEKALGETKQSDYKMLSDHRNGIPAAVYKEQKVACMEGRYYFPVLNDQESMVGLRVWDGPQTPVMSTSGTALHLGNGHALLKGDKNAVFICEGDHDFYALEWLRKKNNQDGTVVFVPGANIFKKEWIEKLKGRPTYLLYDNDGPGQSGLKKAADLLTAAGVEVHMLVWPSVAEGYDVNDFVAERLKTPNSAWKELMGMTQPYKSSPEKSNGKPIKPVAYPALLKEFKKHLHVDNNYANALIVSLATALSIRIPGDPVWMFVVGPPGSGKTLLLSTLQGCEGCWFESSLSPHSLVSGFRTEDGTDPSIIEQAKGRCLVLKDYTEVKAQPITVQEEIYGVLRGAFDGYVKRTYGNGITREYTDCHFSMLAGVTHIIHGDSRASLGERFLKFEFIREGYDPGLHIRTAISGMDRLVENESKLKEAVKGFFYQFHDGIGKVPTVPPWVIDRIVALTQIIAYLRVNVDRGRMGDLNFRPIPEMGTRLAKQLIKLGQSIALVLGVKTIDKRIYGLMEQCAFDTATGFHLDIIRSLMGSRGEALTKDPLAIAARMSDTSLQRKLDDLVEVGAVTKARIKKDKPGQPAYGYKVAPNLAKLWKEAKVGQS